MAGHMTGHKGGNMAGHMTGHKGCNMAGHMAGHMTGHKVGNMAGHMGGNMAGNMTGHLARKAVRHEHRSSIFENQQDAVSASKTSQSNCAVNLLRKLHACTSDGHEFVS